MDTRQLFRTLNSVWRLFSRRGDRSGHPYKKRAFLAVAISLLVGFGQAAMAQQDPSPLHPVFPLLDSAGSNVLDSGNPVSTMNTCGACHDTQFIAEHSFHSDAGLSSFTNPGDVTSSSTWDTSPGFFGRWDPIRYRYLSPEGAEMIDLTTPEWIQRFGAQHVGGGPAEYGRDGTPLVELPYSPTSPETNIVDAETGELVPWDWQESGIVEMNCFLCHTPTPNNEARVGMLQTGQFGWANSATLLGSGIIEQTNGNLSWNPAAFDASGQLLREYVTIQDPNNLNCGQCHGLVHVEAQTPLVLSGCEPTQWSTITTGQIISPQRIAESGVNVNDKEDLSRSWDVHSERVVECVDCHYALNNPVFYQEDETTRPEHLTFDPRRLDFGEYLYRPVHEFAKGQSAQSDLAPELDNSLRRCESCHSTENTHDWLQYKERHMAVLSCETCHIPQMYSTARQFNDWTVLRADGSPYSECRGVDHSGATFGTGLITGFQPVLLPRQNRDGTTSLAPFNMITSWFWVYGDPERPVPLRDLQAVWLADGQYQPEILAAFDANGDGALDEAELVIDTEAKETLIAARLEARGLSSPRIVGEIRPYSINHTVTSGEWAIRDCDTCHTDESRVNASMILADRMPGGVQPTLVSSPGAQLSGEFSLDENNLLVYQPDTDTETISLYIFGHDSVYWVDWFGILVFLGTLIAVSVHGGLRYLAARRLVVHKPELKSVYMYTVYERQWHWLQTVAIFLLLFTGIIIHEPDKFRMFPFAAVVQVHNILAVILVVNAALAAFYHLASGEIQQFLPRPYGFFDQAFEQAKFYLYGIFKGEEHPFAKTRQRKMNPLQQITYFGILNVLLPLQVITGAMMWGAQTWPDVAARLGGLPFLAPFHTLIAWLFATFIVGHVYLTTTGPTPLANIKAMMMGWDDVEVHGRSSSPSEAGD